MILPLALMLMQPVEAMPASAPPIAEDPEIVVLAERLKTWRGTYRMRDGKAQCRTKKSTGDKGIDAAACTVMTRCSEAVYPRIRAEVAAMRDSAMRDAMLMKAQDEVNACMVVEGQSVVAALRAQRKAELARNVKPRGKS